MFVVELLVNSAVASNCYIVLNMPNVSTFHISHITWSIILQLKLIMLKSVNGLLS